MKENIIVKLFFILTLFIVLFFMASCTSNKELKLYKQKLKNEESRVLKISKILGKTIYERDNFCIACHGKNGEGITNLNPPLFDTEWVTGNKSRLIKLTLKGIHGPIKVGLVEYDKCLPMPGFEMKLTDIEIAAVLTYIRNSFGNKSSLITAEEVQKVREKYHDKTTFFHSKDLLKMHPIIP